MKITALFLAVYILALTFLPTWNVLLGNNGHCCYVSPQEHQKSSCCAAKHDNEHQKPDNTYEIQFTDEASSNDTSQQKGKCSNCSPFCCFKCVSLYVFSLERIQIPEPAFKNAGDIVYHHQLSSRDFSDIWHPPI